MEETGIFSQHAGQKTYSQDIRLEHNEEATDTVTDPVVLEKEASMANISNLSHGTW